MEQLDNARGGYRFLTGIPPFSSGAAASDGFEIVHVTLTRPVAWRDGFARIDRLLGEAGRPRQALCAIALRSPAPMSRDGFDEFNAGYRALLADWDILVGDHNPVARTNVAPIHRAPDKVSLYSFAYTVPAEGTDTTFVIAGAADAEVIQSPASMRIVRDGETGDDAMAEKSAHVMARMDERLRALGLAWADVTRTNIYTVHGLRAYLSETILAPLEAAAIHGIHWHLAHPPIAGLAFEMDVRGVRQDLWLQP